MPKGSNFKQKKSDTRFRYWIFVLYPESMPDNTFEYLESLRVPVVISPLHCNDVYTIMDEVDDGSGVVAGEFKKSHYHCLFCFDDKTSLKQVKKVLEPLGCKYTERCGCPRAMIRYFIHKDNPQKAQYSKENIKVFSGADKEVAKAFKISPEEYGFIYSEFVKLITGSDIREWHTFVNTVLEIAPDKAIFLNRFAFSLQAYIRSRCFGSSKKYD